LDFSIAPAYYQTNWFRLLCLAAFLALLWGLYQLRLQQLTREFNVRLDERVTERTRIARELHDTLLQNVQGLILKLHAVAKHMPHEETSRQAIEKALDHADQVLAEGRDRVRNLRATAASISDLSAAFQRVAEETAPGRVATLRTVVEGDVRALHPMILEESYSIGREALINALVHSEGLHVEVEITYDARQFRLRIRDDGRGINADILEKGGRADHWGLQGMRERAGRIGAQLEISSRPGTGTEVGLTVPAVMAYRALAKSKSSWFRRSPGVSG
jgi:signal transduction histidine kinase